MSENYCNCGCIYLEEECPNCNSQNPQHHIEELEAKLELAVKALLAFQSFERSAFFGQDADKNKQAVYRGVKRKITKAIAALGLKQ